MLTYIESKNSVIRCTTDLHRLFIGISSDNPPICAGAIDDMRYQDKQTPVAYMVFDNHVTVRFVKKTRHLLGVSH